MNTLKFPAFILFLPCFFLHGQAQTVKTIEDMSHKHQACLDSGKDMLGCSRSFYSQMDSMITVVYDKLITVLNLTGKATLKKDQLDWLKKRDVFFKKQDKVFDDNYKKGKWGLEMQMVTYDDKADFIKKRILLLIRRLNK
jgi:uncharacterized protein YecT (DUF1311 family)